MPISRAPAAWYLGPDGKVARLTGVPPINWVGPQLQWDLGRSGERAQAMCGDTVGGKEPRKVRLELNGYWVWADDAMPPV